MQIEKHTLWTYLKFDKETEQEQDKIEELIKHKTGVRPDGYMYSPAYRRGVWDGYKHFYEEQEQKLPTGLIKDLFEVIGNYQQSHRLEVDIIDKSPEPFLNPEDIPDKIEVKDGGKITLRDYQYGAVRNAIENSIGILNQATNVGKCINPYTYILTSTGYRQMADILLDYKINADDTNTREIPINGLTLINAYGDKESPDTITVNGTRDLYEITLYNGITQKVTGNHPLMVLDKDNLRKWKQAKDIKVGDYVVSRRNTQVFGNNNHITPDEAYFIALMIADGYIAGDNTLSFTNDQPELLDYVEHKFKKMFMDYSVRRETKKGSKGISIRTNAKKVIKNFHDRYGLDYVTSESKEVPKYIMESPKETQVGFLSAYLETEGSFNTTDKLGSEVTSKSYELIHAVQLMLFNMGILSRMHIKIVKKYPDNVYYRLTMSAHSTRLLMDLLHFKTAQRQQQTIDFNKAYKDREQHNGRDFTNPYIGKLMRKYYKTYEGELPISYRKTANIRDKVGSPYVKTMLTNAPNGDPDLKRHMYSLIDEDLYYNKVITVTTGTTSPTFDFHMPKTHSFIAEGNINHNTAISVGIIKVLKKYLERGEKVAYIVPSKVIFSQAIDTMKENFGREVGWMGDGKYNPKTINVILMPTLVSKLKKPTKGLKLTGKDRANQLFIEEVIPKLDGRRNLNFILTNFLKNYQATTKAREDIKEYLQSLLDKNYSDAQIQLELNNQKVQFNKLMKRKQGNKYELWKDTVKLVEDTKVVIVDEGHHSKADTYYDTLMQFTNAQYRFAMSGSVDKSDKLTWQRLRAIYEQEIYVTTNEEMIERGISAKPFIRLLNIRDNNSDLIGNRNYMEVYDKGIVNNVKRNNYIAQFTNSFYKMGKKVLIIVNRVEHGELIMERLDELGVQAAFINGDSSSEERQEKLDAVRDGKLHVLIATGILDEGLNVKGGLDLLVMAGSGKSLRLILQRVGRVLRKRSTGENMSVVLDFIDRTNSLLYDHSISRLQIYQEQGFDIKELN